MNLPITGRISVVMPGRHKQLVHGLLNLVNLLRQNGLQLEATNVEEAAYLIETMGNEVATLVQAKPEHSFDVRPWALYSHDKFRVFNDSNTDLHATINTKKAT